MEVIFKGETVCYLLEDLVIMCLNICTVEGKEVGKHLWKLSFFSVNCDFFLTLLFPFYFVVWVWFCFLLFKSKELPGNYCRSSSEFICKTLYFFVCLIHAEKQHSPQEAPLISRNQSALVRLLVEIIRWEFVQYCKCQAIAKFYIDFSNCHIFWQVF